MTVQLTLFTDEDTIRTNVADFAKGLGCSVAGAASPEARELRTVLPDGNDTLLELLTHVALTATKAGMHVSEPLCRVTYRHQSTSPEVALEFRLTEFNITSAETEP